MAALARAPWAERFSLYYDLLRHNARTEDVVRFLRKTHARLRRPLLLVCDRLPAHRAAVRWLRESGCSWLHVAWLPGYAPDLDPVENLWSQSKYGDLANFIPDSISELQETIDTLLQQYRHDPGRLYTFFHAMDLVL